MELSALAAHEAYGDDFIPGAGMITGIGKVAGRECMVVVNDPTVKGGSYYPLTVKLSCYSALTDSDRPLSRSRSISAHKRLLGSIDCLAFILVSNLVFLLHSYHVYLFRFI